MNLKKTYRALLLTAIVCLGLLGPAMPALAKEGDTAFEHFTETVQAMVQRNWPLMEKVWPGADYKQHDLLLAYVDDALEPQAAYAMNAEGMRKLTAEEAAELALPQPGGYAQLRFKGRPAIALSTDAWELSQPGAAEEAYRTATHELVHFYHQDALAQDQGASRAQPYPVDLKPRLYRQMIYLRMIQAFETPEKQQELLGKARHWLKLWESGYLDEAKAIHSTDMAEGSARYIENLGAAIGQIEAGGDRDQLLSPGINRDEAFVSADAESYELGYVAALLLDRLQPNWKEDFYALNRTPVQRLLEAVSPVEDQADAALEERLKAEVSHINDEAGAALKDIVLALKDKSIPWLRIDNTDAVGSFQMNGNYWLGEADANTGMIAAYAAGGGSIALKGISAVTSVGDKDESYLIIPLTMPHKLENGRLTLEHDQLSVKSVAIQELSEDGRSLYHVKADGE